MNVKIHKKADNDKEVFSIDVFRNDKWAYTITEEEFKEILVKLAEDEHGVPTIAKLKEIVSINAVPKEFKWIFNNNKEDK